MTTISLPQRSLASAVLAAAILFALPAHAQPAADAIVYHPATHSHNDYHQPKPLFDALDSGMASIEADIYYVEFTFLDTQGESRALRDLYVAHDWEEIEGNVVGYQRTRGTLSTLYLDPLWELYHQRGGNIYPGETLLLHADMKTDTEATWRVLENTLRNYPGLFTTFDVASNTVVPGPVTIYTNDEPTPEVLAEYGTIHSTADGRFGDIFDPASWQSDAYTQRSWRMPIISSNLRSYVDAAKMFDFLVPEEDIASAYSPEFPDLTAENLVSELHKNGWALATRLLAERKIRVSDYLLERMAEASRLGKANDHLMRFWASPDEPWFWDIVSPLDKVVLLTDRPKDVSIYLASRDLLDQITAPRP